VEQERAAAAVAAASQQKSCPSEKPLGASSSVSVAHLSCKSVGRILDRKNRPIGDERILDVSSDYPEWKNSGCKDRKHKSLARTGKRRPFYTSQRLREQKGVQNTVRCIDMLFLFFYPQVQ